ncbi:N-acetylmuramoyl-L-alanine amidase isoform X2 [Bombina bombina]|uniref:N-acetylmuramoyl-L-alanine amidase isoform X2 n=1 Tax=Bombina bombina TaxID=8345 RepID=UPI00235A65F2|nr:N-acetylmuramoyl-L-alanine amidase isoform X2 [Bombina bombina]
MMYLFSCRVRKRNMVILHLFFLVLPVCLSTASNNEQAIRKMDTFISFLEDMESTFPESSALTLTQSLISVVIPSFRSSTLTESQTATALKLLHYKITGSEVTGWNEHGVVLAPDGSTVALIPLLWELAWGWKVEFEGLTVEPWCKMLKSEDKEFAFKKQMIESCTLWQQPNDQHDSSQLHTFIGDNHPLSFAAALGLAFLSPKVPIDQPMDAVDGCWNSISNPSSFQLSSAPKRPYLTVAFFNGALDGILLGEMLRKEPNVQNLSTLLQNYYGGKSPMSPYRRQNFQSHLVEGQLETVVKSELYCMKSFSKGCDWHNITDDQLETVAAAAAKEFTFRYLECPAIIPRCMWGAKPYNGSPTLLKLPLPNIFIHHTYEPSRPCTSFADCSANMQSMQNFHQEGRGWDDIGYSFVVGSDGYVYAGRGWFWVGAHTKGHNSVGFGVSFIGDYTSSVPEGRILSLVKDQLIRCAVRSGYMSPNYAVQGHRQLVSTSCPGDALFKEIKSWDHFKKS